MEGWTVGQIVEALVWLSGAITAVTVIIKAIRVNSDKRWGRHRDELQKMVTDAVTPLSEQISALERKQDESEIARVKDFLVSFLARVERNQPVDEEELERFWENYDYYDQHGGNSFVHSKMEKLKKAGKL